MAATGIFYVAVHVADLERSKQFYGQTLGWKLGTNEESVAGYHFGSSYLVIVADNRSDGAIQNAGGMSVAVKVEDVAAEHERLKGLDVSVGDLVAKPWGEKSFSFFDPDGYAWSYCQDPEIDTDS